MSEPTEQKPTVNIRNWFYSYGSTRLSGNVVDHPRFDEDVFVTTSAIVSRDDEAGIVETRNTVYILNGKIGA